MWNQIKLEYFSCGIIISSLNFLPTDSAFTERILGLPAENYKGYVEADATQRARLIKSHSFFLIHGLADSTAPYIHGIQLAKSLTDANILYRYQVGKLYNKQITDNSYVFLLLLSRPTRTKVTHCPVCSNMSISRWSTTLPIA